MRTFESYCKEGIMRRGTNDPLRAKSMIQESERKMRSMSLSFEKIGITADNAGDYAEQCYDIIMFLIRARLYLEGYSSSGKGSHEAEIAYLQTLNLPEKDILFIDELRYLRNGILYYGKPIDKEYASKAIAFTKKIISQLKVKQ